MLTDGRQMFGKENTLGLLTSDRDVVAENEAALFVGVSVKVKKGEELTSSQLKQSFDSVA